MLRRTLATGSVLIAWTACTGPKEAENPRTLLGEDLTHQGVYGGGASPDTPGAAPRESSPAPGKAAPPDQAGLATHVDCETAARHLVTLGIDLAIREEPDQEKKAQLSRDRRAALESERARAHVRTWTRECLEAGTTAREARCIARIRAEADIDACVGEP
jgi:hypothetical protein